MANTVNQLNYTNTFGDWIITTNALAKENNDLAANNYTKSSGTLYLNDSTLGLQVGSNAIIGGTFAVNGPSANVLYNMAIGQQLFLTNTITGLISAGSGNFNGTLYANSTGTGLYVSNNASILGSANVSQSLYANNAVINNISVPGTIYTGSISANSPVSFSSVSIANQLNANAAAVYVQSLQTLGQLSVGGNFVINGATIYNSNTFTLSANVTTAVISQIVVNRGTSGANAVIRWNEPQGYWDVYDINTSTYQKLLSTTALVDTLTNTSVTSAATANTANALYNLIKTANTFLQANVGSALAAGKVYTDTAIAAANTSLKSYTDGQISNTYTFANNAFNLANATTIYAQAGYGQANSATIIAAAAFNKANGAEQIGFTTITSNGSSVVATSNNDTLTITAATANGINLLNPATKTLDFGLRNSGIAAGTYGGPSYHAIYTIDQFGRATAVSNVAIYIPGTAVTSTVNTAFNLAGGSAYQVPYQLNTGTTAFSTTPQDGQVLQYTAAGGIAWATTGGNALHGLYVDNDGNLVYDVFNGVSSPTTNINNYVINFYAANTSLLSIAVTGQLQTLVY